MTNRSLHRISFRPALLCALLCTVWLSGCHAPAPAMRAPISFGGEVRAENERLAQRIAKEVESSRERVLALLPDSHDRELDVWIQDEPALYSFPSVSYSEADGFWAERPGRIHLRHDADDLERTLVHELVHATLGCSWHALPGTLEEGLCDLIAVELCADSGSSMRAGRLSAACFALGGLDFDLEVEIPHGLQPNSTAAAPLPAETRLSYVARILLQNETAGDLDPLRVFDVRAGLSSTRMKPSEKKAFYGLGYAVVSRIVERRGLEGLHELCLRAKREGHAQIPTSWLLEAAELGTDRESWRLAIIGDLGPDELEELVAMYPQFVGDALLGCRGALRSDAADEPVRISLRLPHTGVALELQGWTSAGR